MPILRGTGVEMNTERRVAWTIQSPMLVRIAETIASLNMAQLSGFSK